MKEWILYCVLCSLIYALSSHAQTSSQPDLTADVIFWNKARLPVLDCAILMPNLDEALGAGATKRIQYALKT
jgi:hypothetical protein